MKPTHIFAYSFCSVLILLGGGCATPHESTTAPSGSSGGLPVIPIEKSEGFSSSGLHQRMMAQDTCFCAEGTPTGIQKITLKNEQADIRNLAAFAIAYYRKNLSAKLDKGEDLNQFEIDMLQLAILSYQEAIKSYCRVAVRGMIENSKQLENLMKTADAGFAKAPVPVDGKASSLSVIDNAILSAVRQFETSDNKLRKAIERWTVPFRPIDDAALVREYKRVLNNNNRVIDYWNYRGELRPFAKFVAQPGDLGRQWKGLERSTGFYVSDLHLLHNGLANFISKTSNSDLKLKIEDISLEADNNTRRTMKEYRNVFVDVPFVVSTKKAMQETRARVSAWPWCNGTEGQESAISAYIERICNDAMLKQIRSQYSANLYRQYLEYLKEELGTYGTGRYEKNVLEKRIPSFQEMSDEPFSDNKTSYKSVQHK